MSRRGWPPPNPPESPPNRASVFLDVAEAAPLGISHRSPGLALHAVERIHTRAASPEDRGDSRRTASAKTRKTHPGAMELIIPMGCFFLDVAETAPLGISHGPPDSPRALWSESTCARRARRIEGIPEGQFRPKPGKPNRVASGPTGVPTKPYILGFDRLPPPGIPSILWARPARCGTNPRARGEPRGSTGLTGGGLRPKPRKTTPTPVRWARRAYPPGAHRPHSWM